MNQNQESISESMEMYLVTVVGLRKENQPVPLSQLAEALSVTPVSVNEMCRKLQDIGYLVYQPYKGAVLTEAGEELATHVLRRRRLWEVFLIQKLHLDDSRASEAACELEHVVNDEVIDRLDEFLGFPKVDPHGLPIPTSDGQQRNRATLPLSKMPIGRRCYILNFDAPDSILEFLTRHGVKPGIMIKIIAVGGDDILVDINGEQFSLSIEIAEKIMVSVSQSDENYSQKEDVPKVDAEKQRKGVYLPMKSEKDPIVEQLPLNELKKGQQGIIVQVGGKGAVKRRMMDMGVVPGSEISVVRFAPFGDPIEFNIKGYKLSLRKSEAEKIIVEKID